MTTSHWDIIVIGAGMAGLKAAFDLQQLGLSVVVLEARERIGGRIYTDRSFNRIPIELGAELVHSGRAETWEIIKTHHILTHLLQPTVKRVDHSWQAMEDPSVDMGLFELPRLPQKGENLSAYLSSIGLPQEKWPAVVRLVELDMENVSRWSALTLLDRTQKLFEDAQDEDMEEQQYRIPLGYDQLPLMLAGSLNIHLQEVVKTIDWSQKETQVLTANGHLYCAERIIVTLPLGVLKSNVITFSPALPAEKQDAVEQLGICDIVKIFLEFDHRVLPEGIDVVFDEHGLPPAWWRGSAGHREDESQVLVGWAAADNARQLMALGEEQALQQAMKSLRHLLRQPNLQTTRTRLFHWNHDPFACGAYTYTPPGAEQARSVLAKPMANKVFWAGEATDDLWFSTVQGAYRSGARAATEVRKSLEQTPFTTQDL